MAHDEDDLPDEPANEADFGMAANHDEEKDTRHRIDDVFKSLPLFEHDLYMRMQAMNLMIVDSIIEDMETDLLAEYIRIERTPAMSVMMVSALSQLWIFGVYELLRTWRQRVREVLRFGDEAAAMDSSARDARITEKETKLRGGADRLFVIPHGSAFRRSALEDQYREVLRSALYRSEIPFRRIESLRLHLAKHEVPKRHGVYGAGAGYSRIDHDGSIQYHVPLGDSEVDLISRSKIAQDLRELLDDRPLVVLSAELQAKVKKLPQHSYGIKRVVLRLNDGSTFQAAIAWDMHVVFVRGYGVAPFPPDIIVDVEPIGPDVGLESEEVDGDD